MTPGSQQKDRCVLTRHDVQSIKDLVFVVGGNSESSAQKAIFEILANNMRKPHPAASASEQEIRVDERKKVLDEIIKLSTMLDKDETEKWESFGRPKNDGYINGSHSGYLHATRDIRSWIERIKWAERRHPAASEQEIRTDEREKVLDELKAWLASDREFCHRIGAIPAMLSHACVIDRIETMRRQPPGGKP